MRRWSDWTSDPNSIAALNDRADTICSARRPPIGDRLAYLRELARGKRVLDVGVVNHVLGHLSDPNWLHGAMQSVASYILGVDILPDAVARLREAGFNVRLCDITCDAIDEQFDVMIVGEVIEHLTNPGALFEAAARQLLPGGRLVITSPNPFYVSRIRDAIRQRSMESVDHVTYLFPSGIAEMAERNGLALETYRGISANSAKTFLGKTVMGCRRLLHWCGVSKDVFCNSLIYECIRSADGPHST